MRGIDNRSRGTGKTVRLLYASDFNKVPILCLNSTHKKMLIDKAKQLRLHIPTPITVDDILKNRCRGLSFSEIYCDEAEVVFTDLVKRLSGLDISYATTCIPFVEEKRFDN